MCPQISHNKTLSLHSKLFQTRMQVSRRTMLHVILQIVLKLLNKRMSANSRTSTQLRSSGRLLLTKSWNNRLQLRRIYGRKFIKNGTKKTVFCQKLGRDRFSLAERLFDWSFSSFTILVKYIQNLPNIYHGSITIVLTILENMTVELLSW